MSQPVKVASTIDNTGNIRMVTLMKRSVDASKGHIYGERDCRRLPGTTDHPHTLHLMVHQTWLHLKKITWKIDSTTGNTNNGIGGINRTIRDGIAPPGMITAELGKLRLYTFFPSTLDLPSRVGCLLSAVRGLLPAKQFI
nr:PREDICTED: uncharacterized protein LOC106703038 [Latimeria chalumnae]|eukprot:XP_014342470.1 PREDICTED: uncharacterized protein LOC106703038 [Latimeria chalumnae]